MKKLILPILAVLTLAAVAYSQGPEGPRKYVNFPMIFEVSPHFQRALTVDAGLTVNGTLSATTTTLSSATISGAANVASLVVADGGSVLVDGGSITVLGGGITVGGDVSLGGNDLTATGTGQTFNIVSAANDATVSGSVAAITMSSSVSFTQSDLVLAVRDSSAAALLTVDSEGDTGVKGRLSSAGTQTCTDSGDGNPGALTLQPTQNFIYLTVADADGCTVTMGETDAINGTIVVIVNASTPAANFADTAGVSETTGAIALGQYDSLTLVYAADRWVELATSNN